MVIYNAKEMPTKYMREDNVVVEIRSPYTIEEFLTKLRDNEEIPENEVNMVTYHVPGGAVITDLQPISDLDKLPRDRIYGIDNKLLDFVGNERLDNEDLAGHETCIRKIVDERPQIFRGYEGFQFNNPWKNMPFEETKLTKEELIQQLFSALGIMPTLKDANDKSVAELKKMSSDGDRLYWWIARRNLNSINQLPSQEDIEFYESLNDYEKRLIIESECNPRFQLLAAKAIKGMSNNKLYNITDKEYMDAHRGELEINTAAIRAVVPHADGLGRNLDEQIDVKTAKLEVMAFVTTGDRKRWRTVRYAIDLIKSEIDKRIVEQDKHDFMMILANEQIYPNDILLGLVRSENAGKFCDDILDRYSDIYENAFLPKFQKNGVITYTEKELGKFLNGYRSNPMPAYVYEAERVFKEKCSNHAPMVLAELMEAQALALGKNGDQITDDDINKIVADFNQKNISVIAKYRNPALFAFSSVLKYNEMRDDHIKLFASMIRKSDINKLIKRGFLDWYLAHKDVKVSDLAELLEYVTVQDREDGVSEIKKYDPAKTVKQLIMEATMTRAITDCQKMEAKYNYKFENNELAIRGRHIVAKQGALTMYMLQADDYRNFTVGYDTHCCQHFENAGESCVWKYTTDPFAGVVVIERNHKILAQGFVWTDEAADTLVFDNVEFANDRNVQQFSSLFAAWSQAMPYQNIHVGVGYNQGMNGWGKKIERMVQLPTTLSKRRISSWATRGVDVYSDYHENARALKKDGNLQIEAEVQIQISSQPDEPTRWDVLARPALSFLLNDCDSSIEERLEFARRFYEEQTPEIQLEAVKKSPIAIQYIEHPTIEVQRYVIGLNPDYASYIRHPGREVQEILIDMNPEYIKNIEDPDEGMMIAAIRKNGKLLPLLKNPTEAVYFVALEVSGYAILDIPVDKVTENMEQKAAATTPKIVSLLHNPSPTTLRIAIDKDPDVAALIPRLPVPLQVFAINKKPSLANSLKDPSYEAIEAAVKKDGLMIRNFQFKYPALRTVALRQNGYAINALKNPTIDEYIVAAKQNRTVVNQIQDEGIRNQILTAIAETARPASVSSHNNEQQPQTVAYDFYADAFEL